MGTFTGASPGAVEKKVQTDPGFEDYGNFPTHNREMKVLTDENMAHEALHWLRVLHTYQDHALAPDQLSEKYLNMSIAATILGGTGHGEFRQQYWSAKAVRYGQMSQNILVGMVPHPDRWVLEEIQTRLLVAMALYYYSGGDITRNDLTEQFKKIDKVFLVRTGFCNNKVLRSLAADHLIELPNCLADVWI